jgi:hypothetical protein
MFDKATAKITAEMNQNKNDAYIQVIGEFLARYLAANPGEAEKILAPDKTIKNSLDAMRKEAEKHKSGNCAVLTDAEGFAVVLKYFGIDSAAAVVTPEEPPAAPKPAPAFDVRLEDFL